MLFLTISLMRFPLQKVDITSRAVLDIMTKTTEYLQPNPGMKLTVELHVSVNDVGL